MSRATYIYTVQGEMGAIFAAYTVKHELAKALEQVPDEMPLVISRVRDGQFRFLDESPRPVLLDRKTLEPKQ